MGLAKKPAAKFVSAYKKALKSQANRIADTVVNCNQVEQCENTDNQETLDAMSSLLKRAYENAGKLIDQTASSKKVASGHARIATLLRDAESNLRAMPRVNNRCQ